MEVWNHPEREDLFCEKIDFGGGEIREIASGLRGKVPLDQMKDKYVVCILNLKARALTNFPSHGMVLCGENADGSVIELLTPPEGSAAGDLISFEGQTRDPAPGDLKSNKNAWHKTQPEFNIRSDG